jgi:hypothetical protein
MAQHIPVEAFENKRIQSIGRAIKNMRYLRGSMKFRKVGDDVWSTERRVPHSVVAGGWATFEVHYSKEDRNKIERVYLVA